jgi:flagellar basal-body rod modification protein FlgD
VTLDTSAVGPTSAVPSTSSASLGGLDSDAFLKLLVAQMKFQDPMAPTDTSAMMQQTATFAQVERLQEIATVQQQMLTSQLGAHASSLVGRHVTAEQPDGTTVEGLVDAVRYTADGPVLSIGDDDVTLTAITRVSSAAQQPSSASA